MLAAGASTRLKTPKQLIEYRGRTLLRRAAETALGAAAPSPTGDPSGARAAGGRVVVVVGAQAERMRAELAGLDVDVVENQEWEEGLSTSLRAGLVAIDSRAARDEPVDAVLFTTCDQPRVSSELLRDMIAAYAAARPPIVACEYGGTVGVPALFDRALFEELRELRGDAGAKRVIERHLDMVARVPFPEAALDIDTAEDAGRLG